MRLEPLLNQYDDGLYHEGERLPACKSYQNKMNMSPEMKPRKQI